MNKKISNYFVNTLRRAITLSAESFTYLLGNPPVNSRGNELDAQLQGLLPFRRLISLRTLLNRDIRVVRLLSRQIINITDIESPQVPFVEDRKIKGPGGAIPLRIYGPNVKETLPGSVFFHGGGFVLGDLETHDAFCRYLAIRANCRVVSVDYRLAPENPFPAAINDGVRAFRWVRANASELNIDPDCIAVAGDSAGATLGTVVCQRQIDDDQRPPDLQMLLYPKTDHRGEYSSRQLDAENSFLTWSAVKWFSEQYLSGVQVDPTTDYRVSPLRFNQLNKMPPTLLSTAGFDPLRDEGRRYAEKLEQNGVRVIKRPQEELIHGFISIGGVIESAREAMNELAGVFGDELRKIVRE